MTKTRTASELITEEVTSWPGVTAGLGERGEFAFKVGRREIGHLHGDYVLHTGFPKPVGRAPRPGPHRLSPGLPQSPGLGRARDPE